MGFLINLTNVLLPLQRVMMGGLLLGALLFPVSVAGSNLLFAIALVVGLFSGVLRSGAEMFWRAYRGLALAWVAYVALMLLGLLWSEDVHQGLRLLGRSWFWLLMPLLVAALADGVWRYRFLLALSVGLALHLLLCLLQLFGVVEIVNTGGSGADNPTGLIGHIGFGFVYGIWAAWLVWVGFQFLTGWQRAGCWGLAMLSYGMIFIAQGRAGQLVSLLLLMVVFYRMLRRYGRLLQYALLLLVGVGVAGAGFSGAGGDRWRVFFYEMEQMNQETSFQSSHLATSTGQRLYMLKIGREVWAQHPWLGVGSGGFFSAIQQYQYDRLGQHAFVFKHPHNQLMLNLVRWGPLGLLCTLAIYLFWLRAGFQSDWRASYASPLILMSGLALLVDAFFGPTFEEHFSGVLAALLLGVGLSDRRTDVHE